MAGKRVRTSTEIAALLLAGALGLASGRAPVDEPGVDTRVVVSGRVRLGSSVPKAAPIDMGGHPYCAAAHAESPTDAPVAVNPDGFVEGVVVYVRDGVPSASPAAPSESALLDQRDCFYTPRVLALRTGQPLVIRNSDATLHNVHVFAEENRGFNIGQPLRGIQATRRFARPEIGIEVRCDIHGWMHAAIAVFDHGFFAVSGPDGTYQLPDLPAGEYVVEAWHPALGRVSESLTVTAGSPARVDFVLP